MQNRIISGLIIGSAMLASLPANALQCVPYAREHSGISIRGDAWTWWSSAAGVYDRGHAPRLGAVVVFKKHGSMRHGHVAVVTQVLGSRQVMVDHANWAPRRGGHRGQISRNMAVVDVSPRNDWTEVRVWNLSTQDYGTRVYPTYGFIYSNDDDDAPQPAARLQNASFEVPAVSQNRGGGMLRMPQEQVAMPDQRLIAALADLDPVPAAEKVEVKALEVRQVEVKPADIKVEVKAAEPKESKAESKSAAAHPVAAQTAQAVPVQTAKVETAKTEPAKIVVAKVEPTKVEAKVAPVVVATPAPVAVEEDGDAALAKRFGSGRY